MYDTHPPPSTPKGVERACKQYSNAVPICIITQCMHTHLGGTGCVERSLESPPLLQQPDEGQRIHGSIGGPSSIENLPHSNTIRPLGTHIDNRQQVHVMIGIESKNNIAISKFGCYKVKWIMTMLSLWSEAVWVYRTLTLASFAGPSFFLFFVTRSIREELEEQRKKEITVKEKGEPASLSHVTVAQWKWAVSRWAKPTSRETMPTHCRLSPKAAIYRDRVC